MSYYLNIYRLNHQLVRQELDKGTDSQAYSELMNGANQSTAEALTQLFTGRYTRDPDSWESPDANRLISSLELVCRYLAGEPELIVFYLDDDRAPEICTFAFNDWDSNDDFGLPVSSEGTPAVIYRDAKSLPDYGHKFQQQLHSGEFDSTCIAPEELMTLITTLSKAIEENQGMFIFCHQ